MTSKIETLKKFLADDPSDPFNHYALALEYVGLKKYTEALRQFENALNVDRNYVPAYHQAGLLLAQLGRTKDALEMFEKGVQAAALVGDTHAVQEMQEAIDELE